jgi:hypothetical protein
VLLSQVGFGCVPSQLATTELPQILLFPIVFIICYIISVIPLSTSATFTGFTAINTFTFATLFYQEQSFRSEPILSQDCSFLFNELGDDLIGHGSHCGIFVNSEVQ